MKQRNSSYELLRIIAMCFIVIGHISTHAQKGELASHNYISAICTTGVNIFILISGYFRIRINWKSLLTLYATCMFFYAISILGNLWIFNEQPDEGYAYPIISPVHSPWWFINCYLQLMLLSPLINASLDTEDNKRYRYIVGILLFISCISGFYFENYINKNGYNLFHFITVYVVGDAVRRSGIKERFTPVIFVTVYMVSSATLLVCSLYEVEGTTYYNNPILLLAAVSLFCLISKLGINSKAINTFASFMLPVYLLQDGPFGNNIYQHLYDKGVALNFSGAEYFSTLLIYIILLFIVVIMLDSIKRLALNKPIERLSNYLDKKANIFS